MTTTRVGLIVVLVSSMIFFAPSSALSATVSIDPGIGNVPQALQSDSAYAGSFKSHSVSNVFVTSQQVSCYRPEVPLDANNGPNDGYTGEAACPGATTGEDTGAVAPYPTQAGSESPYPAATSMLVTDHSESDIRVDPTNQNHVIASSKWFTSAEGYNHLVGFYESWDGGKTWPVMGHVPGYEGFTDNTDPVGAFDAFGNYYQATLPYQFFYDSGGHKKYEVGNEPNPAIPNEAVAVAVRRHGAKIPTDWITTHNGSPDYVFTTNAGLGQEPDKEWIAIATGLRQFSYRPRMALRTTTPICFRISTLPESCTRRSSTTPPHRARAASTCLWITRKTAARHGSVRLSLQLVCTCLR